MSRALYVVIRSRDQWWVDFEGKPHGPHASIQDAVEEGRELAQYTAHMGRTSELLVPDENGRYRVVWASDDQRHRGYSVTSAA